MIGNNSCGVHGLLGGKVVDNVESLDIVLYDGTRMTVGRTSPDQLDSADPRRRPRGPDLRRPRAHPRPLRRSGARKVSAHSAPRLRLQPRRAAARERLPRRARAGRHRRHLRQRRLRAAQPHRQPALPRPHRARLPRCISRRRRRSARARTRAHRSRRLRSPAGRIHAPQGPRAQTISIGFRPASAFCWSKWARGPPKKRTPKPKPLAHDSASWPCPASRAHLHARRSRKRLARARIRARRHGLCARRARPLGRMGRRRRSSRAARRLSAQRSPR